MLKINKCHTWKLMQYPQKQNEQCRLASASYLNMIKYVQYHSDRTKYISVSDGRATYATVVFQPNITSRGCCLMTPGLSKDIQFLVLPLMSLLTHRQVRHQAINKMGCQLGASI